MASINLPDLPKSKEFEEYIAAHFNSSGLYVDRNLLKREEAEESTADILELDVYTTNYSMSPPKRTLVEIKSGKWGFSDVFKIRGWMDYLNLDAGLFVTHEPRRGFEAYERVANEIAVQLLTVSDLNETAKILADKTECRVVDERDVNTWRFSYWVEQALIEKLKHKKRSHPDRKRYKALDSYLDDVNNGTFFRRTIHERAHKLYDAFKANPLISAKCAHEEQGDSFDDDHKDCPQELFDRTFHKCKYTDIQLSTYIEHRARIAILKAAVDYCLFRKAGDQKSAGPVFKYQGMEIPIGSRLPDNFISALGSLESEPYFHLYPVFWQWFLWVFGGFILDDLKDQEYELLSAKTGVPVDSIEQALTVYDTLFPTKGKWLKSMNSNIRIMAMFPVPFMGVGSNFRRYHYCPNQEFKELNLTTRFAKRDVLKWNDLVCEVLRGSDRYKSGEQDGV